MLRKLTYKQKLRLTGVAALVAVLLCYKLAVSNTITEYQHYKLAAKPGSEETGGMESSGIRARQQQVDFLFSQFSLDTLTAARNLLKFAGDYCQENDLTLKEYRPWRLSKKDSIEVLTRVITVEGNFRQCVEFLHTLEIKKKTGRAVSVDFKSFVEPQDKKLHLNCTIYIQNLIAGKYEN
jgi:hypothetical protein